MTKDVVVVAWVDGPAVTFPSGFVNPGLIATLNTPVLCSAQLLDWLVGIRSNILTDTDRRYANAFLLANSRNSPPPRDTIDPDGFRSQLNFRMFHRLKVTFEEQSGQISNLEVLETATDAGPTPDPCGALGPAASMVHPMANGAIDTVAGETRVFSLNEARLGIEGQLVDRTLNGCTEAILGPSIFGGGPVPLCLDLPGPVTPWIWSVIKFDSDGNLIEPIQHQIFPAYTVYVDGAFRSESPQPDAEPFIQLDAISGQLLPGDIQ